MIIAMERGRPHGGRQFVKIIATRSWGPSDQKASERDQVLLESILMFRVPLMKPPGDVSNQPSTDSAVILYERSLSVL